MHIIHLLISFKFVAVTNNKYTVLYSHTNNTWPYENFISHNFMFKLTILISQSNDRSDYNGSLLVSVRLVRWTQFYCGMNVVHLFLTYVKTLCKNNSYNSGHKRGTSSADSSIYEKQRKKSIDMYVELAHRIFI